MKLLITRYRLHIMWRYSSTNAEATVAHDAAFSPLILFSARIMIGALDKPSASSIWCIIRCGTTKHYFLSLQRQCMHCALSLFDFLRSCWKPPKRGNETCEISLKMNSTQLVKTYHGLRRYLKPRRFASGEPLHTKKRKIEGPDWKQSDLPEASLQFLLRS